MGAIAVKVLVLASNITSRKLAFIRLTVRVKLTFPAKSSLRHRVRQILIAIAKSIYHKYIMHFPIFKLENEHTKALIDPKSGEFVLELSAISELIQGQGIVLNRIAGSTFTLPSIEMIFADPIVPLAPYIIFDIVSRQDK